MWRSLSHIVKYLWYDAAGENKENLKKMRQKHGIIIKKTAPDTPQQIGVVERQITL
jgi:hypothetical protein